MLALRAPLAALLFLAAACGPPSLPSQSVGGDNRIGGNPVVKLFDDDMSHRNDVAYKVRVSQLFLMNRTPTGAYEAARECANFTVKYHWQPGRQLRTYDLRSDADVSADFPFNPSLRLGAYFERGQTVRVRVGSRGSWVLDLADQKIPRACARGVTHYVRMITAGAFLVTTLSDTKGGASVGGPVAGLAARADNESNTGMSAGDVFRCDVGDATDKPPPDCDEPVEVSLGDLSDAQIIDDAWAEPGPGTAKPATPQPESTCYQAVTRVGDPSKDIVAIGAACGDHFGLKPLGEPYVRQLSSDQGWQRQFEIPVEAGACYRMFATGGSGIDDLDIGLKDSSNAQVAVDGMHGPVAVIAPDGPFCAQKTETLVLLAKVEKGSGSYGLWVWKKR